MSPLPTIDTRIRDSFARQTVMTLIGAELTYIRRGEIWIEMPYRPDMSQQHGFIHAGIITTIVDSACGYAAMSVTEPDTSVLTMEFKINFLAPAQGERFIAKGKVKKAGRTITVCEGDVTTIQEGREKLIATMLASVMNIRERTDLKNE